MLVNSLISAPKIKPVFFEDVKTKPLGVFKFSSSKILSRSIRAFSDKTFADLLGIAFEKPIMAKLKYKFKLLKVP